MATNSFTGGAGTGNLATAGNWSLGAVPVSTNDVIIGLTGYDLFGDMSAGGTVDLASLTVTNGWYGTAFGLVGSLVTFKCTAGTANIDLGPRCNLAQIAGSGTVARLRLLNTGSGQAVITGGTFTKLEGGRAGTVLVGASAVVTNLFTCRSSLRAQAGTAFTTAKVGSGGSLWTDRDVTTGDVDGSLRMTLAAGSTLLRLGNSSALNLRSSGTNTEVYQDQLARITLDGNTSTPVITTLRYEVGAAIEPNVRAIVTTMDPIGATS